MASRAAKGKMPTWATGKAVSGSLPRSLRGFTLLELLLVVAIVAVVSVGASLALRDSARSRLDTEAQRLAALLEAARAQSRASGAVVQWRVTLHGFGFVGLPDGQLQPWQDPGTRAELKNAPLLLGPDPIVPRQSVRLWQDGQEGRSLWVATDGVRPFAVVTSAP